MSKLIGYFSLNSSFLSCRLLRPKSIYIGCYIVSSEVRRMEKKIVFGLKEGSLDDVYEVFKRIDSHDEENITGFAGDENTLEIYVGDIVIVVEGSWK